MFKIMERNPTFGTNKEYQGKNDTVTRKRECMSTLTSPVSTVTAASREKKGTSESSVRDDILRSDNGNQSQREIVQLIGGLHGFSEKRI